eukprot:RCo033418
MMNDRKHFALPDLQRFEPDLHKDVISGNTRVGCPREKRTFEEKKCTSRCPYSMDAVKQPKLQALPPCSPSSENDRKRQAANQQERDEVKTVYVRSTIRRQLKAKHITSAAFLIDETTAMGSVLP